jgi:hypothetical protein
MSHDHDSQRTLAPTTPLLPTRDLLTGYRRVAGPAVRRLDAAVTTDVLGTGLLYYAVVDGAVWTSGSVRALAGTLGAVTLEPLALAETLAFGYPLRERTIVSEVRTVPAHATLHVDGRLERHDGPRATAALADVDVAAARVRAILEDLLTIEEPRHALHLAGLTGGRDSRILAALARTAPERWHWLSVTGAGDAEHVGSLATAARLALPHHAWLEWKADYLAGLLDESADLVDGLGAVSDATLLSGNFARYRAGVLGRAADDPDVALWLGTLGDELLAGTWLPPHVPAATTIEQAITPRVHSLPRILAPSVLERFADEGAYYRSNPFAMETTCDEDTGWLIRQLTRGRSYLCRLVKTFDRVCPVQLNPYMHPAMLELVLTLAPPARASDGVRTARLRGLGPGLDAPSADGFKPPAYAATVLRAVVDELAGSPVLAVLARVLDDAFVAGLRRGELRDLAAPANDNGKPLYRSHDDSQPLIGSLRDYEHLLTYASFVRLLAEDGVRIGVVS